MDKIYLKSQSRLRISTEGVRSCNSIPQTSAVLSNEQSCSSRNYSSAPVPESRNWQRYPGSRQAEPVYWTHRPHGESPRPILCSRVLQSVFRYPQARSCLYPRHAIVFCEAGIDAQCPETLHGYLQFSLNRAAGLQFSENQSRLLRC